MSEEVRTQDLAPNVYINLLAAQGTLEETCDQMRWLSKVLESIGGAETTITIRPEILAGCVSDLADDLEDVAEAVRWSKDACFGDAHQVHRNHDASKAEHRATT
jgi:hypothetical protein